MYRGSTPTQIFNVDIDLREADVYVTYSQSGETVIEHKKDESMTVTENMISYKLTQEETLKLSPGSVEIQIKYKLPDGTVDYSNIIRIDAERVLKGEVI